jgi:NAD(P)-dependent dehydrogenase (short-subunit alcohol dehydrogenase family)
MTGRRPDRLAEAARIVADAGSGDVLAVAGDAGVDRDLDELAAAAVDRFGRVDVLVNNAPFAAGQDEPLLDVAPSRWEEGLAGCVRGPLRLLRHLVEPMRAGGRGSVVNVVSTAAFSPMPRLGPYGVAKAAMWAVTLRLARELAPDVRVNAVCPGTVSGLGDNETPPERLAARDRLLEHVPLGRRGLADEAAFAAQFLASPAAAYTTGQVLFVDGGRTSLCAPV